MMKKNGFTLIELMIVIAIIGIKFTEVTTAVGPLKQQVELCFHDLGTLSGGLNPDTGATECSSTDATGKGTGWNLKRAVADTSSKYVKGAVVNKGTITISSQNIKVGGISSFTEILVPTPAQASTNGDTALNWKIDSANSTCKDHDLC